jgi:GTP-binding protein HflX
VLSQFSKDTDKIMLNGDLMENEVNAPEILESRPAEADYFNELSDISKGILPRDI